jgi:hypothetical protein
VGEDGERMADWIFWITWNIPIYVLLVCLSLFWHNRSLLLLNRSLSRSLLTLVCLSLFWHNRSPCSFRSLLLLNRSLSSSLLTLVCLSLFWHNRSPCSFVSPYSGTAVQEIRVVNILGSCSKYTRALTSPRLLSVTRGSGSVGNSCSKFL